MKKILFIVFSAIFFVACDKHSNNKQFKEQTLLNEDEVFISLIKETNEYLEFLASNLKSNSVDRTKINQQLSELQSKNLPFDNQLEMIDLIYKAKVSTRLKEHMVVFKKNMDYIESNYGNIDQDVLKKEAEEVLNPKITKPSMDINGNPLTILDDSGGDCTWRYFGCSAAATAGAVICHAGCDATALAATAGLGIPACVAACGTLQAWAIVECADRFCK